MSFDAWRLFLATTPGISLSPGPNGLLARVGRCFNQGSGGLFVAIGAAWPLRG